MTCVIFAVSGLRHRNSAADDDVDMLVILTACYFHDIVSTEGEKSSATAAFFNPGGRRDASPAP